MKKNTLTVAERLFKFKNGKVDYERYIPLDEYGNQPPTRGKRNG